jgi:hypothetical protein
MKVRIVFDVEPWMVNTEHIWFRNADTDHINKRSENATRYLIECEIPEPIKPDNIIQAEAREVGE